MVDCLEALLNIVLLTLNLHDNRKKKMSKKKKIEEREEQTYQEDPGSHATVNKR